MKSTKFRLLIFSIILALALTSCAGSQSMSTQGADASGAQTQATPTEIPASAVIAEGHLVPARDATLAFQGGGTVTSVSVKVGDTVKEGDVLARLGSDTDQAYAAAQMELVSAQQAMKDLRDNADKAKAQALIALDNAQEAYDKAEDYRKSLDEKVTYETIYYRTIMTPKGPRRIPGLKTHKTYPDDETKSDADNTLALRAAELKEAQRVYDRVKNGPDTDQLALLEARLNAAKAGVAAFELIAPFDGIVMDVNVAVGEQVGIGTWGVKIADTSAWYVETSDLTELEVVKVSKGQGATILADALPDAPMKGKVESISQAFVMQSGDVLYKVKIKMNSIDPRALWGMTVEVTFDPSPEL